MKEIIRELILSSIKTKETLLQQTDIIVQIAELIIEAYHNSNKILIVGNGGSAADSQHLAAELVGRFKKDRKPLSAIALTVDTSIITAVGNDYGFEKIFSRQVEGLGTKGDILIAISTSGNSKNVIEAIHSARAKGMKVVTFLGGTGGLLKDSGDINLIIHSTDTPRVQECHELIIHILCDIIEKELFK